VAICLALFSVVWKLSNGVSIVSPEALGALFTAESVEIPSVTFRLNNLGLNDNHCEFMAQELARDDALLRPIDEVDLTGNPYTKEQGYTARLGILNQRFDIEVVAWTTRTGRQLLTWWSR
jgi:hypothetical protein